MIDREWNTLPGTPARMLPVTRGPNIFCSNTYIIDDGSTVMVIDPGTGEGHDSYVSDVVAEVLGRKRLLVLLTHSHFDHSRNAIKGEGLRSLGPLLVVHRFGALAMESADDSVVQSGFFGEEIPPVRVDVHLFHGEEGICSTERVPGTEVIAILTPGHSPDSVCYLLGRALFTGDLLFSADPGVAGLEGWDRQDLIRSAEGLREMMVNEGVELVCPGHGRIMEVSRALPMLSSVSRMARTFDDMDSLPEGMRDITYVEELMGEIDSLLPLVSRVEALPARDMDRLLDAVEEMRRTLEEGGRVELYHALRAREVMRGVDDRIIRWIDRLVEGVMVASRGLVQHHPPEPTDIDRLMGEVVEGVTALADAFLPGGRDTVRRSIVLTKGGAGMAQIEGGRFGDAMMSLLEVLLRAGCPEVRVSTSRERGRVRILVRGIGASPSEALTNRLRSLCRRTLTCGAEVEHMEGKDVGISITMPAT